MKMESTVAEVMTSPAITLTLYKTVLGKRTFSSTPLYPFLTNQTCMNTKLEAVRTNNLL